MTQSDVESILLSVASYDLFGFLTPIYGKALECSEGHWRVKGWGKGGQCARRLKVACVEEFPGEITNQF